MARWRDENVDRDRRATIETERGIPLVLLVRVGEARRGGRIRMRLAMLGEVGVGFVDGDERKIERLTGGTKLLAPLREPRHLLEARLAPGRPDVDPAPRLGFCG